MTLFRTIDGTGNNVADPTLNAAGTAMDRIGVAHFNADGTPLETVNPREVSNAVVGEGGEAKAGLAKPEGLSGFMYAWVQFIDHDLDLVPSDGVNHIDITVPAGDPNFPAGSVIPLTRAVTDADGAAINSITGWLDASMVYGSSQEVADALRLPDGHLLTADGSHLPLNADGTVMAGDVRAQENPSLTALQELFVREHNTQVDTLHAEHPGWTPEHLYQEARAIVGGEIAHITYSEFLPHLLGKDFLTPYQGYDPTVDPTITEEFAGAAYRFGHSIVSDEVARIDNAGNPSGNAVSLAEAFFLPNADFNAFDGADGFLRHLASEPSQALDARIVDSLRNFLDDPPAGQDLAAINIQRGHDLGLGTLNETREALGLNLYTSFDQITHDPGTLQALENTFSDVDHIDLWTGGLSEDHMANGAMVGETFGTIIAQQFENLRDGDRLWFENAGLPRSELAQIENTTLSDVIERNTDTTIMQKDAFVATERHGSDVVPENPQGPQLIIDTGAAHMTGGIGNDTLVAGATAELLMLGGRGADTFHFDAVSAQSATIADFKRGQDQVEFANIPGAHDTIQDLHLSHNPAGDIVIDAGHDHIVLQGVHAVDAHDFSFV